jgi:putative redox protein
MVAELVWARGLRFDATSGSSTVIIDGDGIAGPSPMQALAFAVAGCMAADVVSILEKGRHRLDACRVTLTGTRATEHPKRFTHLTLDFQIRGAVPDDALARAVALSRDKYCSALHSLKSDITLDVRTTIEP